MLEDRSLASPTITFKQYHISMGRDLTADLTEQLVAAVENAMTMLRLQRAAGDIGASAQFGGHSVGH
ncbi:hypothetical protein D3C84_978630 [compost metagenome]